MTAILRRVLVASLVLLVAPAIAQTGDPSQMSTMQQLRAMQQDMQDLNAELMEIQEATFEENPALEERRDDLMDQVDAKMIESGFDGPGQRAELDSLVAAFEDTTLAEPVRMSLQQEIQSAQGAYQQAQQSAFQDPEIQAATEELNTELVEAMKETDPKTQELIDELQSTQQRFQQLMQQAMQQQQQQGGPMQAPQGPSSDPNGQR
mgnify:CR=1 FL=1